MHLQTSTFLHLELERSSTECKNAIYQNSEQMIALIEQDRDKLLNQIKSLKDVRKKQLEKVLNRLNEANKDINTTLQKCGMIAINTEMSLMQRLQNIQKTIQKLTENEIKNELFDGTTVNTADYKLKLNMDLEGFIDALEKSTTIAFDGHDTFELHHSKQQNLQLGISPNINHISQSKAMLPGNLSPNNGDLDKICVDAIKLEYNLDDFIINTSSPQSMNETFSSTSHKTTGYEIMNGFKNDRKLAKVDTNVEVAALPKVGHMNCIHNRARSTPDLFEKDYSTSPYSQHSAYNIPQKYNPDLSLSPYIFNKSPDGSIRQMPQKETIAIEKKQNDPDALLVDGYIRQRCKSLNIALPPETYSTCWKYYHFNCELLKFSKIYKSKDGWRFYDGNTCIQRLQVATSENMDGSDSGDIKWIDYKWILADFEPITHDTQCWRINLRNPNKGLIVIGVCRQQMFKSDDEHNQMVYGVGIAKNKWYPIHHKQHNKVQLDSFNRREFQIDMKLNSIKRQLVFCILPNKDSDNDKKTEFVINGLPTNNNQSSGWVPYFNSYQNSVGCQLKIAACPTSWYSKHRHNIFD